MIEIYKNTLLLIHFLTQLSGICYKYYCDPKEKTAEKLIGIVDKCDNKFLKVKEEIVRIVQEAENREKIEEVSAIKTEDGFLIKDKE